MPSVSQFIKELLSEDKYDSGFSERIEERIQHLNAAQLQGMYNHLTNTAKYSKSDMWTQANKDIMNKIEGLLVIRTEEAAKEAKKNEELRLKEQHKRALEKEARKEKKRVLRMIAETTRKTAETAVREEESKRQAEEKIEIMRKVFVGEERRDKWWRRIAVCLVVSVVLVCVFVTNFLILIGCVVFICLVAAAFAFKAYHFTTVLPMVVDESMIQMDIKKKQDVLKKKAIDRLREKEQRFQEQLQKDRLEKKKRIAAKKNRIKFEAQLMESRRLEQIAMAKEVMEKKEAAKRQEAMSRDNENDNNNNNGTGNSNHNNSSSNSNNNRTTSVTAEEESMLLQLEEVHGLSESEGEDALQKEQRQHNNNDINSSSSRLAFAAADAKDAPVSGRLDPEDDDFIPHLTHISNNNKLPGAFAGAAATAGASGDSGEEERSEHPETSCGRGNDNSASESELSPSDSDAHNGINRILPRSMYDDERRLLLLDSEGDSDFGEKVTMDVTSTGDGVNGTDADADAVHVFVSSVASGDDSSLVRLMGGGRIVSDVNNGEDYSEYRSTAAYSDIESGNNTPSVDMNTDDKNTNNTTNNTTSTALTSPLRRQGSKGVALGPRSARRNPVTGGTSNNNFDNHSKLNSRANSSKSIDLYSQDTSYFIGTDQDADDESEGDRVAENKRHVVYSRADSKTKLPLSLSFKRAFSGGVAAIMGTALPAAAAAAAASPVPNFTPVEDIV